MNTTHETNGFCSCDDDGQETLDQMLELCERVWGVNGKGLKAMLNTSGTQQCCVRHNTAEEDEQQRAAQQLIRLFS